MSAQSRARGFTLIELIVVILVLGILAGLAVVSFSQATAQASAARAKTNLRSIATAVVAQATLASAPELSRELIIDAIEAGASVEVEPMPGVSAGSVWYLGTADQVPDGADEYAVGFDDGHGNVRLDNKGRRAVVVASGGGDAYFARVISWQHGGLASVEIQVPEGTSPETILTTPGLIENGTPSQPTQPGQPGQPTQPDPPAQPAPGAPSAAEQAAAAIDATPATAPASGALTSTFNLSGPERPQTGMKAAHAAVTSPSDEQYLLHTDGTVSLKANAYGPGAEVRVPGLTGVRQLVAGEHGGTTSAYARHGDGTVTRIAGTTTSAVPELGGTAYFSTFMDRAVYAIGSNGSLTYLQNGALTPVTGAANVLTISVGNYQAPRSFARTTEGTVLYVVEGVAHPVAGIANARAVVSSDAGDRGWVLRQDGTLLLIEDAHTMHTWPSPDVKVSTVPGVSTGERLIAPGFSSTVFVTTPGGGLLAAAKCQSWDQGCTGTAVVDTGLSALESFHSRTRDSLWVTSRNGELYEVATGGSLGSTSTAENIVTDTGLRDVVGFAQQWSGGLSYALLGDGTLQWMSPRMTVFGTESGGVGHVFCGYGSCYGSMK